MESEELAASHIQLNIRDVTGFTSPSNASTTLRKTWIFHGTRFSGPNDELIYQKELDAAYKAGVLTGKSIAYSREPASSAKYVQDLILEEKDKVLEWIKEGAFLYVCGSNAMAKEVHSALSTTIGEETLAEITQQGRYVRGLWG